MTAPLDEKGLDAAEAALMQSPDGSEDMELPERLYRRWAEDAIRAYLSAVALPDELEVVAWRSKDPDDIAWTLTPFEPVGGLPVREPLVSRSQAHSTIAALRARIDELEAAVDAEEKPHGMPWRFWSAKASEMANKAYDANTRAEAAEAERDARQRKLDMHEAALSFVHRWAVQKEGNGTSAEERLSAIAHHPAIAARKAMESGE